MDIESKNKFLKTSKLYLKITEHDANAANMQNATYIMFLEKKMSNRFFHNSKSVLFDKIS